MKVRVYVTLKTGVLDPAGQATRNALAGLGFAGVSDVHIGKFIEIELEAATKADAEAQARAMSEKLLANLVMEQYRVEVLG